MLKLKTFADKNSNVAKMMGLVPEQVESTVGKVEYAGCQVISTVGKVDNAGYQHFLLFIQYFQKASLSGSMKF